LLSEYAVPDEAIDTVTYEHYKPYPIYQVDFVKGTIDIDSLQDVCEDAEHLQCKRKEGDDGPLIHVLEQEELDNDGEVKHAKGTFGPQMDTIYFDTIEAGDSVEVDSSVADKLDVLKYYFENK